MNRFKSSLTESAIIGAVAGVTTYVGGGDMVASMFDSAGLGNIIPGPMGRRALVVFGVVVVSDLIYNMFLVDYANM